MSSPASAYRGRFAPSPTGPLHLGSLIAALASFLDARHAGGNWLLRMEDIDPPREQPGAALGIIQSLRAHGLHWDESILWQRDRSDAYTAALDQLNRAGHLFRCVCTRKTLAKGGVCGGNCRTQPPPANTPHTLRLAVPAKFATAWTDRWQGVQHWPLGRQLDNFILRRRDGLFAYQLAVVVDDAEQRITQVIRGSDLLGSTPRQHCLQLLLGYPRPGYGHLPIVTDLQGHKLSKQTHAPALRDEDAVENLCTALAFLGQPAPTNRADAAQVLRFAIPRWSPQRVPAVAAIALANAPLA